VILPRAGPWITRQCSGRDTSVEKKRGPARAGPRRRCQLSEGL